MHCLNKVLLIILWRIPVRRNIFKIVLIGFVCVFVIYISIPFTALIVHGVIEGLKYDPSQEPKPQVTYGEFDWELTYTVDDKTINIKLILSIFLISLCFLVAKTKIHAIIRTTIVLIAVPKFDSIFSTPNFPNIEVNDANKADNKAYINHAFPLTIFSTPCFF